MRDNDGAQALAAAVRAAYDAGTPIEVVGGGTRRALGRQPSGTPLSVAGHVGIVEYDPAEFVVTVRAGTMRGAWGHACPRGASADLAPRTLL